MRRHRNTTIQQYLRQSPTRPNETIDKPKGFSLVLWYVLAFSFDIILKTYCIVMHPITFVDGIVICY